MGCAKGGLAGGSQGAMVCKDGTTINIPADPMRHYLKHGRTGCLCPDGIFPKYVRNIQGSAKRWSPGCVNAAGKAR